MLKQILQKYIDQPVQITVFNSKSRKTKGKCLPTPPPPSCCLVVGLTAFMSLEGVVMS